MQSEPMEFEQWIGRLLEVLDEEVVLLDLRVQQLQRLAMALAGRDEKITGALLEQIEQTQGRQEATDARLGRVRDALAGHLGWQDGPLRLGQLIGLLPGPIGLAIEQRRDRIIELADRLQRQNMQTAIMLSECVHLNRLLIQSLLPETAEVNTYGNQGSTVWRSGAGLVDARG